MIKSIKKLTNFKFVNMFRASYKAKDGKNRIWDFASRRSSHLPVQIFTPDIVCVVPFLVSEDEDDFNVVMLKQFRPPVGGYQLEFPAGIINPGESVQNAAARELREETGLELGEVIIETPPLYSSAGLTDEAIVMVFAACKGELTTKYKEAEEDIEILTYNYDELKCLVKGMLDNKLSDMKIGIRDFLALYIIFAMENRGK